MFKMESIYRNPSTSEIVHVISTVEGDFLKMTPERDGLILFDQTKIVPLAGGKSVNDLIEEHLKSFLEGFEFFGTEDDTIDVQRKVLEEMQKTPISFMDGDYEKEFLQALILCVDLRGFSDYTRDHPRSKVKKFLEKYTQELLAAINMFDVSYYKLLGDGALVIWDRPDMTGAARAITLFKLLRNVVEGLRSGSGFPNNIAGCIACEELYKYEIGAECSGLKYRDYLGYGINLVTRLQSLAVSGELLANGCMLRKFGMKAELLPAERKPNRNFLKGLRDEDYDSLYLLIQAEN